MLRDKKKTVLRDTELKMMCHLTAYGFYCNIALLFQLILDFDRFRFILQKLIRKIVLKKYICYAILFVLSSPCKNVSKFYVALSLCAK